jgi:hypothetical protein
MCAAEGCSGAGVSQAAAGEEGEAKAEGEAAAVRPGRTVIAPGIHRHVCAREITSNKTYNPSLPDAP